MHAERHTVSLTTAADGSATGYTPAVTGRVLALHYVKPDSVSFADTVDFDITVEVTGEVLLDKDNITASASFYPRKQVHDTAGAALTLDGTRILAEPHQGRRRQWWRHQKRLRHRRDRVGRDHEGDGSQGISLRA
jgi:hypothetical protein